MVYAKHYADVIKDKNHFFSQPFSATTIPEKLDETDQRAEKANYSFLLKNQIVLEAEFNQNFASLKKQRDENNEAFWLYCYYCSSLLEAFYKAYSQHAKEEEFANFKLQIRDRMNGVKKSQDELSFIASLEKGFCGGFRNLMKTPLEISRIRNWIGFSNMCRIYWIFCRLTLVSGFTLAKNLELFDKLDSVLGIHIDADKIISVFQAPNGVLNYFSVGLFLGRLLIDGGLLIKHTFFPTKKDMALHTTAFERFKYELYKRHCNFANDITWATVNFLTNFSQITHIPGPVGGAITAVFLGFDVCMALYRCYLAKQEYLIKKAQYEEELKACSGAEHEALKNLLKMQMNELEINWRTKEATWYFAAAAAGLLMLGFSAALIFSPPGMVIASFFMCTVAVSMYLSMDSYTKYREKGFNLKQQGLVGQELLMAHREFEAARNDFIFTLVKNAVVPTVLITTFAVCWPAAIILTALYLGYELYHSFDQHKSTKAPAPLSLPKPKKELDVVAEQDEEVVKAGSCCAC